MASVALSARALLRWQFRLAHQRLDGAIERLGAEAIYRSAPNIATSAGACYGQMVVCEDLSVNGVLVAGAPLALSTWAGRTGLSTLPPLGEPAAWHAWARSVRLDLAALRAYAHAVYDAIDTAIAALPAEAFDFQSRDAAVYLLSALLLTVSYRHGEITCLLECQPSAVEVPFSPFPSF